MKPPLNSPAPRRFRAEWALAAGSVVFVLASLAAAEGLLRVVSPDYLERRPAQVLDVLHRYSEAYGWELRPGARQRDGDHWMSVNAGGYRGAEIPRARTAGRTRVVMLGDSITFGTYVGDGQTFADHLHRRPPFEVANLAVQGYGIGQSLLRLEREGLAFKPDIVVLNVCLANDFADIMLPSFLYDARHPKPYFRLTADALVLHDEHLRLNVAERLARRLRERSHLYNRVSELTRGGTPAVADPQAPGEWVSRRNEALRDERAAQALAVRLVARAHAASTAHGAAFVALLHPDKASYARGSAWIDALVSASELRAVTLVDLRQEYQREGLRYRDLTLDGLGHLSPDGHARAAAIVAPFLEAAAQRAAAAPAQP